MRVCYLIFGTPASEKRTLDHHADCGDFRAEFRLHAHESAPANECRNILHVGHNDLQKFLALSLCPGSSTGPNVDMTDGDMEIHSVDYYDDLLLRVGQVTHVVVRVVGNVLKVYINGRDVWVDGGFSNKVVGQPCVLVWFSDPWHSAANVTVANLVYTPLYECGPIV